MTPAPVSDDRDLALRERIIEAAREEFFTYGYSKVSMSEVASVLGISKKTLYKEFDNKEEILRASIIPRLKETAERVDAILEDKRMPFSEKLAAVMSAIGFQHQRATPVLLKDIAVHAPELWREIQAHKQLRFKKFGALLEEGIKRGYFRADIPQEIILRCYTSAVENLMTPQALGELPCTAQEVFRSLVTILFEGILRDDVREEFTAPLTSSSATARARRSKAS